MDNEIINQIAELIDKSSKIVFFGGAGVSTESGVKDYRSEDGLYNTVKEYGVSPEVILSHSFFIKHTDIFYDFYRKYFIVDDVKPNKAHLALAELEKMGKLSCVITQNIDGLHQKAGSKKVYELHGTTYSYHCMDCQRFYKIDDIIDELSKPDNVPKCPHCGGIIKPDVTLYEESLDENVMDGAIREIENADLLIIGGTSLAVQPACSLIHYFKGDNIILINKEETYYDRYAKVVSHEKIGEVLWKAIRKVKSKR